MSDPCKLDHDRGFLVKTILALVAMVVLMCALLASGCESASELTKEQPVSVDQFRVHNTCFVVFKARTVNGTGLAISAVRYPCPLPPKEQLL